MVASSFATNCEVVITEGVVESGDAGQAYTDADIFQQPHHFQVFVGGSSYSGLLSRSRGGYQNGGAEMRRTRERYRP